MTTKYVVTLRDAIGREREITIHEATSANAASNKALREQAKRETGRWLVVSAHEAGEIR